MLLGWVSAPPAPHLCRTSPRGFPSLSLGLSVQRTEDGTQGVNLWCSRTTQGSGPVEADRTGQPGWRTMVASVSSIVCICHRWWLWPERVLSGHAADRPSSCECSPEDSARPHRHFSLPGPLTLWGRRQELPGNCWFRGWSKRLPGLCAWACWSGDRLCAQPSSLEASSSWNPHSALCSP